MKKTVFAIGMALALFISPVFYTEVQASDIAVTINGEAQSFEVAPRIMDGRTMLPLRAIGESLGMTVDFEAATGTASMVLEEMTVTHVVGTTEITVNGALSEFDAASVIVDGRTLMPVRMLAEAIGASVDWDEATRTVIIDMPGATPAPQPAVTPTPAAARGGTPVRGIWADNVYTNEYLGLRFEAPAGWSIATEAEMAEMIGLGAEFFAAAGTEIPEAFWAMAEITLIYDMMAFNPITGTSVQILYERLVFPNTNLTTAQYLEEAISVSRAMGMTAARYGSGTTRIGAYDWYAIESSMEVMGMTINIRMFVNVLDGFARSIMISYSDGAQVAQTLAFFSPL